MSSIDNRIVDLKFNNSQFNSGVSSTMSALDKLKQSLNFKGAASSLDDLNSKSKLFSIEGMARGVDTIASKFNALSVIGVGALMKIGAKATEVGTQMARDMFIKNPTEGFAEYELKMGSIQTIMAGTGESLQAVNGYLDELNTYSDKTIYSFSDMTENIGKFTNAGVKLDTAVASIQGIANVAALSGANSNEASRAMYNFSQALAAGHVKLIDWKSIENANMATVGFKTELLEAAVSAGTLTKQADGMYKTLDGNLLNATQNFNDTLQDQWMTTEVLTSTLEKYADETTDVGKKAFAAAQDIKTFTMLMDTVAEATVSGWAQSMEIVIGDFEEAKALFTMINGYIEPMIAGSAEARNAQLQIWKDMGGRDKIVEAISNSFKALDTIMKPLKSAWAEVFPPKLGETLFKISDGIAKFTAKLILSEGAQEKVRSTAVMLFGALKSGLAVVSGLWSYFWDGVKILWDLGGAFASVIVPVLSFFGAILDGISGADQAADKITNFADVIVNLRRMAIDPAIEAIRNFGKNVQEYLSGIDLSNVTFDSVFGPLIDFAKKFKAGWDDALSGFQAKFDATTGGVSNAWGKFVGVFQTIWGYLKPIGEGIKNLFDGLKNGLGGSLEGLDMEKILIGLNIGALIGMGIQLKKMMDPFLEVAGAAGAFKDGLVDSLEGLTGVFKAMQTDIKANVLLKIAGAIAILAAAILILSLINPDRLVESTAALGAAFAMLLGGMAVFSKIAGAGATAKMPVIAAALVLLAASVLILATAVQKLSGIPWEELKVGLLATILLIGALTASAMLLSTNSGGVVKASAGLILMATAIGMLSGVVAIFGAMPIAMLTQGLWGLALVLGGLTIAAMLMSAQSGNMLKSAVGMTAMALAINMLVIPIVTLGNLPYEVLVQGMTSLGLVLVGLTLAAVVMGAQAGNMMKASVGLMAMAASINMLMGPIVLLGSLDMNVLIQGILGLAGVMTVLVLAAIAMSAAGAGIVGMLGMAAAILALSISLKMLAGLSLQQLGVALLALAAAFGVIGVAGLLLSPVTPVLLALGAAMLMLGVGMIALAASIAIFSVGLMLLAPGLAAATLALLAFAEVSEPILASVPAMLAVGAGLLVFGAGALVAAVGVLALGAALAVLGIGLTLVGATGLIGAAALEKVAETVADLVKYAIQIGVMSAAFLALGAATVVLGAGLLVTGVGALAAAAGIAMLTGAGNQLPPTMDKVIASLNRIVATTPQLNSVSTGMSSLAGGLKTVSAAANSSSAGLVKFISLMGNVIDILKRATVASKTAEAAIKGSFLGLTGALLTASIQIEAAVKSSENSLKKGLTNMTNDTKKGKTDIEGAAKAIVTVFTDMATKIGATAEANKRAAQAIINNLSSTVSSGVKNIATSAGAAGESVGWAIVRGMARGISNGSYLVNNAANTAAKKALNSAKNTLGIKSPSKEFEKIGKQTMQGQAKGMTSSIPMIKAVSAEAMMAAIDAARNKANNENSWADYSPEVKPTVDEKGMVDATKKAAEKASKASEGSWKNPVIKPVIDTSDMERIAREIMDDFPALGGTIETTGSANSWANVRYDPKNLPVNSWSDKNFAEASKTVIFNQTNNSPKALSTGEVYRNTKNQLSVARGEL